MTWTSIWTSALLATLLSGCGRTGADAVVSGGPQGAGQGATAPDRQDPQVVCTDRGSCPEGVGMAVLGAGLAAGASPERCTGFLVAPDLVLTSSRCAPMAQPLGRFKFVLPELETGAKPAQRRTAARLVEVSREVAVVQLEAPISDREPLRLDTTGVQDGQALWAPVVVSTSDTQPLGELRAVRCRAVQRSLVLPGFDSAQSAQVSVGDCHVEATGHGAPLLDEQGRVHAVITGHLGPDELQALQRQHSALLGNTQVSEFALATQVACLSAFAVAPRGQCSESAPRPVDLLAAAQSQLSVKLRQWRGGNPDLAKFDWGYRDLTAVPAQTAQPMPVCVRRPEDWIDEFYNRHRRGGYPVDALIPLRIPSFEVALRLSPELQSSVEVTEAAGAGAAQVALHFNPLSLAQSGWTTVTLVSWVTGETVGGPWSLFKCP